MLPFACIYCVFANRITDSITSEATGIVFVIFLLVDIIESKLRENDKELRWLGDFFDRLLQITMIIAFAIMMLLAYSYHKNFEFAQVLDKVLHTRVKTAARAYELYGIHMLGTPFEQIGGGGSLFKPMDYFFVDSSFPLIIIRYGVLVFFLVVGLWLYLTRKMLSNNNRRIVYVMTCSTIMPIRWE